MTKYHVKKGDAVVVNAGTWKGREATIEVVLTKNDRVVLALSNVSDLDKERIGKRTVKKSQRNGQAPTGMVERSVSVHVSNVTPVAAKAE